MCLSIILVPNKIYQTFSFSLSFLLSSIPLFFSFPAILKVKLKMNNVITRINFFGLLTCFGLDAEYLNRTSGKFWCNSHECWSGSCFEHTLNLCKSYLKLSFFLCEMYWRQDSQAFPECNLLESLMKITCSSADSCNILFIFSWD